MQETLKPQNPDQVRDVILWAADSSTPLEVMGGGSKRRLGKPVQAQYSLSLGSLEGILFYEPEELVLSARAGTPLSVIDQVLAEKNQMLAFEPADYGLILSGEADQATLGGVIAANLSGSRRFRAGAARDHLLGFQAVNGRGEFIKSGGRVMKNVSGYDLCKLMAGSYGTLAAMTELTVKVLPAPEVTSCFVIGGLKVQEAVKAMTAAASSACDISGAAWLPEQVSAGLSSQRGEEDGGSALCLRLEGFSPSVAMRLKALQALLSAYGKGRVFEGEEAQIIWKQISNVTLLNTGKGRSSWRISIPPVSAADIAPALEDFPEQEMLIDQAGGTIWLSMKEIGNDGADQLRKTLMSCGGHATLISSSASTRASVPVFHPQPQPLQALSRRIKESFDPSRVLNPGRMYGGV